MNGTMKAEKNKVTIRMYRQGLGDCFLLAFNGAGNEPKYMLIDFGVLLGTNNDAKKMKDVAKNIKEATGGHLDVLAVTHEHWDHISGFVKAEDIFKQITVDRVWFGWTEDPDNPLANELRKKKKIYLNALKLAVREMHATNTAFAAKLDGMLSFYGEQLGVSSRKGSDYIMKMLKEKGKEDPRYCYPGGKPQEVPGVEELRFFVLGPPEDKVLLKRSRPRKGEVYLTDADTDLFDTLLHRFGEDMAAFDGMATGSGEAKYPFDPRYMLQPDDCGDNKEFFDTHYYDDEQQWRTIDDKWLDAAGDLALKLDSHTNNTCLVLAIELKKSGSVLLFPGDAQVGNWLSWEEVKWQVGDKEVTSSDLLARTVLYKVAHHGSHNATLRDKGLESMTNDQLAAMIPVDGKMAEKKRWKMPYEPLYERLQSQCKGRIIRLDQGAPEDKPAGVSRKEWDSFKNQVTEENRLYIEYTVE